MLYVINNREEIISKHEELNEQYVSKENNNIILFI